MSFMRGMVTRRGRLIGVQFKDAPDPPPAPDYAAAARATAQGNLEAARVNTRANRINQYTPYGSLTYAHTGNDPDSGWSQTVTLSPEQQNLLNSQNSASLDLSRLFGSQIGDVRDALGNPITMDSLGFGGSMDQLQNQVQSAVSNPLTLDSLGSTGMTDQLRQQLQGYVNKPLTENDFGMNDLSGMLQQQAQAALSDPLTRQGLGLSSSNLALQRQIDNVASNPITLASLPKSMVNADQTGQDAIMARLQPQIEQSRAALENRLANQGIMPGSEAYQNAMRTQQQGENDLTMQAALKGIDIGNAAQLQQLGILQTLQNQPLNLLGAVQQRQAGELGLQQSLRADPLNALSAVQQNQAGRLGLVQALRKEPLDQLNALRNDQTQQFGLMQAERNDPIQVMNALRQQQAQQLGLQQQLRNDPLNVLNALRTGAQVTNPAFERVAQQAVTQGPDLLNAAQLQNNYNQGLYNSQVAQYNSQGGWLGPWGNAGLEFGKSYIASDARLKRDVTRIGALESGLPVYQFRYVWDADDAPMQVGVMAQEALKVAPEAVAMHPAGFLMVDYGRL